MPPFPSCSTFFPPSQGGPVQQSSALAHVPAGATVVLSTFCPPTVFSVMLVVSIALLWGRPGTTVCLLFLASWVAGIFQSPSKVLFPRAEFLASGLESTQFLTVLILQRRFLFSPTFYLWEADGLTQHCHCTALNSGTPKDMSMP